MQLPFLCSAPCSTKHIFSKTLQTLSINFVMKKIHINFNKPANLVIFKKFPSIQQTIKCITREGYRNPIWFYCFESIIFDEYAEWDEQV